MKRKEYGRHIYTHQATSTSLPTPPHYPAAIVLAEEYDLFGVKALSRVGLIGGGDTGARRLPEGPIAGAQVGGTSPPPLPGSRDPALLYYCY